VAVYPYRYKYQGIKVMKFNQNRKVHISSVTKEKLGDYYDYEPGNGSMDQYIKDNGLETFLVIPKVENKTVIANRPTAFKNKLVEQNVLDGIYFKNFKFSYNEKHGFS
jgi:hypothetical protein